MASDLLLARSATSVRVALSVRTTVVAYAAGVSRPSSALAEP